MAKKLLAKTSSGIAEDLLLHNTQLKGVSGSAVRLKEGDFIKSATGVAIPLLRFDSIPFGARPNGSNIDFQFGISDKLLTVSPKVICLGGSVMEGYGLSNPNRLIDRLTNWFDLNTTTPTILNYALAEQTMANLRTVANLGTAGRNIEQAKSQNPTIVYIDESSNWANAYDAPTQIAYMLELFNIGISAGFMVTFAGPRPRTTYSGVQDARLIELNNLLKVHPVLKHVTNINFDSFLKAATQADLRTDFDQGDGIHLNAAGVIALANSITAFLQRVFMSVTAFNQYTIERSVNGTTGWSVIDTIIDLTINRRSLPLQNGFYKARARLKNNTFTNYSSVAQISVSNPTVNLGSTRNEAAGTSSLNIPGIGTAYNGASIIGYSWSIFSGTGLSLVNGNTDTVTVNGLTNGNIYILRLTVTDSNGLVGFADLQVLVAAAAGFTVHQFNMTPTAQSIPGWADVAGHPHTGPITAISNGITYTTLGNWNNLGGTTASTSGSDGLNPTNASFVLPAAVVSTYHFNYGTDYVAGQMNGRLSGFNPGETVPEIHVLGSRDSVLNGGIGTTNRLMNYYCRDSSGIVKSPAFNVKDNQSVLCSFYNRIADSNGYIDLAYWRLSPSENDHQIGYVNGVQVKRSTGEIPLSVNAGSDQNITTTSTTLTATEAGATSRAWSKVTGPVSDYNYEWNSYIKLRTFTITPDADGYKTINAASYLPGDALYFSGTFKGVQISNLLGTAENKILISNKPGETTIIGNEAWGSGSWPVCLNLVNCKHFRIAGTHRSKLLFKGSTNSAIGGDSYEVRSQVQNVRFDEYTHEFEACYFTVTNGGTGVWAKKEVVNGQTASYFPNTALNNLVFHNLEVTGTHNEAFYLGNTATYWNITTNQSVYPNPAVDPIPSSTTHKQPIKINGLKVYNCRVSGSGADGIQLSAADNVEIYNNDVTNWATRQQSSHCAGILIGGRLTNWNVHDNWVHDGWGNILEVYAESNGTIANNLLSYNQTWNEGIAMRATNNAVVTIANNTLIDVNTMVRINGSHGQTSAQIITNNLFVKWRNVRAVYGENGGLETVVASPNGNDSFTTIAAANLNTGNWYLPASSTKGFRKGSETIGLREAMPSVITSPTLVSTTVTDLIPGVHVFRITSSNGSSSLTDDVQVTVT